MALPIVLIGDPVLEGISREIERDELTGSGSIRKIVEEMKETLTSAGGVGLAAPQVGLALRLVLAGSFPSERHPGRPLVPTRVLVNPRIIEASEDLDHDWEGCLSLPDVLVRVGRHTAIRVSFLDLDGEEVDIQADGFFARVLQHEIDHLDGILTLDRADSPEDVRRVEV